MGRMGTTFFVLAVSLGSLAASDFLDSLLSYEIIQLLQAVGVFGLVATALIFLFWGSGFYGR